ncbi:Phosphoglycolate phosphatase [Botrimarina colliarenosi]|uniref:Phosphoglycolate phosphatase n=1 Tax=Botrimarina colliarenosi TaxID=2528001 RepID=A0A5C6A1Y1_9BACT|nr:HAD family hydrolase [Botrimarina colliarenosi]TWT93415.1 Phosphoglycolate phosphatase [Botrimarina colliarenosi]
MKVCLFDIDGTLVLTGGAGMYAFAETFAEDFGVAEISREVPFAGCSDRGIAGNLFLAHGIENSEANWDRFRAGYVARITDHVRRCDGLVLPGVFELIDRLEALGDVHLGLLTGNVAAAAEVKLKHYRLWDRFAFGGFGDDHPDRNDIAMTAVARARERHGGQSDVERIVVIGDTPNDIRCARAVGALAVAAPTGHTPAEVLAAAGPDLLVETLEDADGIVAFLAD